MVNKETIIFFEAMKEIESIMKKYDADQSGDIDFDEFMEMMKAGEDIEDKTMVKGLKETAQQARTHLVCKSDRDTL